MLISRRALGQAVLLGAAALARGAAVPAAAANSAYVFGYFTETPNGTGNNYGLHLAVSADGLNWSPLNQNNPVVTPAAGTGGLRDPYILRKQDGTFVVLATDLNGTTGFGVTNPYLHAWDSKDLITFTGYRRIKVHSLDSYTWAPTAFWDARLGQYGLVYSVSNNGQGVFMVNYTSDFQTLSAPQVYFSPGYNVNDADIAVDGSTFYLYYKNVGDQYLYGARSSTGAPNSYTTYTSGLRQGGSIEAPLLIKNNSGSGWHLWGDSYRPVNNDYYAWSTTDVTAGSWTVQSQQDFTPPLNAKHGSIVGVSAAEYNALVAKWGRPAWNRLKSFNYPDRFVRHADGLGRIDPYPMEPYQDQMWRLVPGLADAAGVSFESVNSPGQYLRHFNFAIQLNADDGTAVFRADATFYPAAGFADSAWSSFRSYNYPDRYLRHSNYVLRIDPITASSVATDKQDATFRILN